jgi:hypothetical protein
MNLFTWRFRGYPQNELDQSRSKTVSLDGLDRNRLADRAAQHVGKAADQPFKSTCCKSRTWVIHAAGLSLV